MPHSASSMHVPDLPSHVHKGYEANPHYHTLTLLVGVVRGTPSSVRGAGPSSSAALAHKPSL